MPQSAGWALQTSIYQALTGDAGLVALLSGPNVFDGPPRDVAYPFVTFGQSTARDWSTSTEDGEEHIVTLHVWAQGGSRHLAQAIVNAIRRVLHGSALPLSDYRLVNIRQEFCETRREPEREIVHGIVRFRAVTEKAI